LDLIRKSFNYFKVNLAGSDHDGIVVSTRHHVEFLAPGRALNLQKLGSHQGNKLIMLTVYDKRWFGKLCDLVTVLETIRFGDAQGLGVNPQAA
jgi:hypothetical protein